MLIPSTQPSEALEKTDGHGPSMGGLFAGPAKPGPFLGRQPRHRLLRRGNTLGQIVSAMPEDPCPSPLLTRRAAITWGLARGEAPPRVNPAIHPARQNLIYSNFLMTTFLQALIKTAPK